MHEAVAKVSVGPEGDMQLCLDIWKKLQISHTFKSVASGYVETDSRSQGKIKTQKRNCILCRLKISLMSGVQLCSTRMK